MTMATWQGEVHGDRAFGIEFSSRYDRAIEIAEMLRFASLANLSGLAYVVRKLWYDSKSGVCVVELADDIKPGSDTDRKLFLIANCTLDQFTWRPDIDDGDDDAHRGGDRDDITECDLASVSLVFPPDGWYRAKVDEISPVRSDGSRAVRFMVCRGPHAGEMIRGQVMDLKFGDAADAWLWAAEQGRPGESRRDPVHEAIGRECVVQAATQDIRTGVRTGGTVMGQTVVRILPLDHPDFTPEIRDTLGLPTLPHARPGGATESSPDGDGRRAGARLNTPPACGGRSE